MTGQELIGGLQIEVTPGPPRTWTVVPLLSSRPLSKSTMASHRTNNVLVIEEGRSKISDLVHVVLLRRGGSGGRIRQTIKQDCYNPACWEPLPGTIFNVQIINSEQFGLITGEEPSESPITAKAYAKAGLPYIKIYDETVTGIVGNLDGVMSVNMMDHIGCKTAEKVKASEEVNEVFKNRLMALDEAGNKTGFRTVHDIEHEHEAIAIGREHEWDVQVGLLNVMRQSALKEESSPYCSMKRRYQGMPATRSM
ncbi:hypothetical protein AC578_8428 [Pseudocercospora eumusae]|uniref:Uncharacterized protein n=1 Tax=Pseudocercospora eumusae TaxID=321146 RepID=A0A139HS02_9PEZI|nr:hypothetical protein AC578_8428 [Pseudocercospora eumusae]